MQDRSLRPGGSVVCWDLTPSSRWSDIYTAVSAMGPMFHECLPSPRSVPSAFAAAVAEVIQPTIKGHKILVRPVKKTGDEERKAFVVVDEDPEIRSDDRFTIVNRCSASKIELQPDDTAYWEDIVEFEMPLQRDVELTIRETFDAMRRTLSAASVGTMLAAVIEKTGGVPLRDRGGTYWLPDEHRVRWELFAKLVEAASIPVPNGKPGGKDFTSKVYGLHIIADEGMIECVGDQMVKSIVGRLEEYKADLMNDKVRSATVKDRCKRVGELRAQANNFSAAFSRSLEGIQGKFAEVEALLATYSLLESAVVEREYEEQKGGRPGELAVA